MITGVCCEGKDAEAQILADATTWPRNVILEGQLRFKVAWSPGDGVAVGALEHCDFRSGSDEGLEGMCRYATHKYRDHFACFHCRKTFKHWLWKPDPKRSNWSKELVPVDRDVPCPQCAGPMANMGLDFRAPRRNQKEAWAVLEILYEEGFAFHGCGCDAGGFVPPTKLKDVETFKERNRKGASPRDPAKKSVKKR